MQVFEYGFDDFVYCSCGKTPAFCLEFKCTDVKHGIAFERHSEEFLKGLVNNLRAFSEMNILILGETGVGKSSWINGFINLIKYESLEDALKGDSLKKAHNGENCATQRTKVYSFSLENTTLRLIDTPGIGDRRGVEQDKKNFKNVLETLSYIDEIHAICIFINPNNLRVNLAFRYSIKELLTYLHRDARENIIFCFASQSNVPDAMPALKKLLLEHNDVEIPLYRSTIYCYDNPPGILADEESSKLSKSWGKSVAETLRMLEHIRGRKPYSVKKTLNLNYYRELIIIINNSVVTFVRNIREIISNIEKSKKDILETRANIEKLESIKFISRTEEQEEDTSVTEYIKILMEAVKNKQKSVDEFERQKNEYEDELNEIKKASACFAYSVKSCAIVPYNDAVEQYLSYNIRKEEDKVKRGESEDTLKSLRSSRDLLIEQRNILENEISRMQDFEILKPADVTELVKKLKNLKHSGKALTEAFERMADARKTEKLESDMMQFNCEKEDFKGLLAKFFK